MATWRSSLRSALAAVLVLGAGAAAQQGSIRGAVIDRDFEAPVPDATVQVVEAGRTTTSSDQGLYTLADLEPGSYTLVVSKPGYVRQVRSDVVVSAGRLTDLDVQLSGDFTEMEEFVVQDVLQMGAGSEAALLELRFESPSFLDSIGADLMSRAGASDAASALTLVSGATVQDDKFAVIRGLPDRFVNTQINGVRLPSADEETRAVELDQFPSTVIESIQISKTFTPDQQGDSSGGAVDLRLKGIPDETSVFFKSQASINDQVEGEDEFLTFDEGPLETQAEGTNWDGDVGVSFSDAPTVDSKWEVAAGGEHELPSGVRLGGFASLLYEKDSSFFDDGQEDDLWIDTPGEGLVPQTDTDELITSLFDITEASETEQVSGLATLGVETDDHSINLTYLFTDIEEDKAILAEDTRGKEFFFPGFDPDDPSSPGSTPDTKDLSPFLRTETLEHTERKTITVQLDGRHTLPFRGPSFGDVVRFLEPELDWTVARNSAEFDQPDKRLFGSKQIPESLNPGFPPFVPPFVTPPVQLPLKPDANFTLGNLQRIFKRITEDGDQHFANLKLPFENWTGEEGYFKFGIFEDDVDREFRQESFSNFADEGAFFAGDFDDFWSQVFPDEDHPITGAKIDTNYDGRQQISAWYGMVDVPITRELDFIGGYRYESTELTTTVSGEEESTFFLPPGSVDPDLATLAPIDLSDPANAELANASIDQDDVLPSFGLVYEPEALEGLTLRGSYSRTIARQTFRELTPVIQQEFLGGPIFLGNPQLKIADVTNYDLRADYEPYEGGLFSLSWFKKDLENPIENIQRFVTFQFTQPANVPEGQLQGYEFETRHDLGHVWPRLEGLTFGANATVIESRVTLNDEDVQNFNDPGIELDLRTRDATNAPEHLYNIWLTYDLVSTGTQFNLFYTVRGDTLVEGAGISDGNFVPSIYEKEFGTLNFSVTQELGDNLKLQFQAKNLTDPEIEEEFRADFLGISETRSSFTRGREFSISLSGRF